MARADHPNHPKHPGHSGGPGDDRDRDDNDVSFAEEMARQGVVRLERPAAPERAGRRSAPRKGNRAAAGGRGKSAPAASAGSASQARARAGDPAPSRPSTRGTGRKSDVPESAPEDREAELRRRLDQALRAAEAERESWQAERAAWQAAWQVERDAWQAERDAWQAERARLAADGRAGAAERQGWQAERSRLAGERSALERQLRRAEQAADARISLRQVLEARGLRSDHEAVEVLRALLEQKPRELLDAVELATPGSLAELLEDRVALVAENLDLTGMDIGRGADCAIVRVSPERCEISGGSDIRAEFRRFLVACRKAALARVTIVGGSQAYRKQLRELAEPVAEELRLQLVPGNRRRERRRAQSDVRRSDLVVVWGPTELDHSVSDVYTQGPAPIVRVPHRGISRMLHHVAHEIDARDRGRRTTAQARDRGRPKKPSR